MQIIPTESAFFYANSVICGNPIIRIIFAKKFPKICVCAIFVVPSTYSPKGTLRKYVRILRDILAQKVKFRLNGVDDLDAWSEKWQEDNYILSPDEDDD